MAVPFIKIENARGEVLDLSADPRYVPILQNGGPPGAAINHSKVGTAHGSKYNSSTVEPRNLLLTIYLKGDIARARRNLYRYIIPSGYIKVYYQEEDLDLWIDGYVETAEVDPWTQNENMAVSILCPEPFWKDIQETYTDASVVSSLFEFPFAIEEAGVEFSLVDKSKSTLIQNDGTVEAGATFELIATNRSLQPRIYNLTTGKYMGFYVDMFPGDRLIINTSDHNKRVTYIKDGVESNYINTLMEGSEWLKMAIGANEYSYTVDEGEMELRIYHTNMYIGV